MTGWCFWPRHSARTAEGAAHDEQAAARAAYCEPALTPETVGQSQSATCASTKAWRAKRGARDARWTSADAKTLQVNQLGAGAVHSDRAAAQQGVPAPTLNLKPKACRCMAQAQRTASERRRARRRANQR